MIAKSVGIAGFLFLAGTVAVSAPASAMEDNPSPFEIRIIYPPYGSPKPATDSIFVFGSVRPPGARIRVNGFDTPLVRTAAGAWLCRIPMPADSYAILVDAVLPDGTETRVIHRLKRAADAPTPKPKKKKHAKSADRVITVEPEEDVWRPPRVGRIVDETTFLRSGPDEGTEQAGYEFRLQPGTLVTIAGQVDNSLHVKLSDLESVWIDEFAVKLLPKSAPIPKCHVNAWTVTRGTQSTLIQTLLSNAIPYRLTPSLDGRHLTLKLYGGVSNTDWIHYASDDPWVDQMAWSHPVRNVYQLDVHLKAPVWGYQIRYDTQAGRAKLTLELKDMPGPPPVLFERGRRRHTESPLAGVTVCVDPGHPPQGATGPLGTPEHAVTWSLSVQLKDILESKGANVILSRMENETMPLPARVERAQQAGADLFLSIHANALAPGEDPFQKNGFSVYYFNSFSQDLASAIHESFREQIPLRDDGLHFGNLHVLRQTAMPAVLIENAYLIWPPEEELLRDPDFQLECAIATAAGVEKFLRDRWASSR